MCLTNGKVDSRLGVIACIFGTIFGIFAIIMVCTVFIAKGSYSVLVDSSNVILYQADSNLYVLVPLENYYKGFSNTIKLMAGLCLACCLLLSFLLIKLNTKIRPVNESKELSPVIPQIAKDSVSIVEDVANKSEQSGGSAEQLIGASVLIVDDVAVNLEVMKRFLEPYNLRIETADSGQQAIDLIIDGNKYDIIFMDHMMPDMDGIEATRIIRNLNNDYVKNVPIVAFTANAMLDSNKMFLENGFDGIISKPIDIHKLDECLNKFVNAINVE